MQTMTADAAPGRADDGGNLRSGDQDTRVLLTSRAGADFAYKMTLTHALSRYDAPRHRHDIDQIRFTIRGKSTFGKGKSMPAGWVGYFPEGAPYGPQVREPGTLEIQCQFGGASGRAYISGAQRKAAIE